MKSELERKRSTPTWRKRTTYVAALTLVLSAAACGPKLRAVGHTSPNSDASVLSAAKVEVLQAADLPTIQLVRRQGDPAVALGIAIFPDGGSAEVTALTALLNHRLKKHELEAHFKSNAAAVLFSIEFRNDEAVRAQLDMIHSVLTTPVGADEVTASNVQAHLKLLMTRTSQQESALGLCELKVGAEGVTQLEKSVPRGDLAGWLEEVRTTAVSAGRVGISAVGQGPLLQEVPTLHEHTWTAGSPPRDAWQAGTVAAVVPAEGTHEIAIALRVSDSQHALSAARALQQESHPLHSRLHGFSSKLEVSGVGVTLRPAGACLSLRLALDGFKSAPTSELVAAASLLVLEELEGATSQSLSDEERTLALVEPHTVGETAALAAWSAVRSPVTGNGALRIVEYRATQEQKLKAAALKSELLDLEARWLKRSIPVRTRDERGQAQLYMMLASPCGVAGEPSGESGLRALTVASLAKQFSGDRGVTLLPYLSSEAIGLIAHGSKMRGETAQEHAIRVARVLAAAFSGSDIDGRAVAEARSEQLSHIGSDPGIALVQSIFGGEHVSLLEPRGNDNTVSTFSTTDVQRSREELAQEPLRLSVLANSSLDQAQHAERAVSGWLASEREHVTKCTEGALKSAKPGQWTLETLEEHVKTGAYVAVAAPVRPEVGHAFAYHLSSHPELFDPQTTTKNKSAQLSETTVSPSELAARPDVNVAWWGHRAGGALVFDLGATQNDLERRVEQVRIRLDALAQVALTPAQVEALRVEFLKRHAATQERPLGRLVGLWFERTPLPPTARELAVLSSTLAQDQHRIVLVKQRK